MTYGSRALIAASEAVLIVAGAYVVSVTSGGSTGFAVGYFAVVVLFGAFRGFST